MPGPPPPPPPMVPLAGMPPPLEFVSSKGGADERGALLKSIRTGAKLRKTITNDKSAPMIGGKNSGNITNSSGSSNNSSNLSGGGSSGGSFVANQSSGPSNGLNLGGLFAGGMPKLRATGMLTVANSNHHNNNNNNNNNNNTNVDNTNNIRKKPDVPPQPSRILSNVQNELKKQMASDNKNRGPPPPAPTRNIPLEEPINNQIRQPIIKNNSSNGFYPNQSSLHSNLQIQNSSSGSSFHRKAKSNANLSSLDSPDSINSFNQPIKPVINYGKPNLAPKPPVLNGKPVTPPKKLLINGKSVSRAQSMKSPRSPSPQSPDMNASIKFGTVKNLSSVIGQSLGHSTGNLCTRPRLILNGRPSAPPPSIPSHQPPSHANISTAPLPPSKTGIVRPPNHAPPPPPGPLPQPPNHAPPPPPPHRTQPIRAPPAIPGGSNSSAPPPPPRHSSMLNTPKKFIADLDEKYKNMFHHSSTFPKPPPYKNCLKLYTNRQAGSKQQAPQPPQMQSMNNRTWDVPTTC